MSNKILIGYRKFTSKKGTDCLIVNLLSDFSEFDIQHGAVGRKCDEVFLPVEYHDLITPDKLNKTCSLLYGEGYGGTPRVIGIQFDK